MLKGNRSQRLNNGVLLLPLLIALGGCVSDTLSVEKETGLISSHNQPQSLEPPNGSNGSNVETTNSTQSAYREGYDPALRQQAVSQMRSKAASQSGEKTVIAPLPESENRPLTKQEQEQLSLELEQTKQAQKEYVSDQQLNAHHEAMRKLRAKGKRHYQDAIRTIEK